MCRWPVRVGCTTGQGCWLSSAVSHQGVGTLPRQMTISTLVVGGVLLLLVGCTPPMDSGAPTVDAAAQSLDSALPSAPTSPGWVERPARAVAATKDGEGVGPHPSTPPPELVPEPVEVEIPTIGVAADLVDLGLNGDRTLEVPSDFDLAGWYTGRPPPGAVGPAIIVGHVDSREGPAVFYRLRDLAAGDEVLVHREDASTARFVVDRVERHAKYDFPTQAVYGPTDEAALRLITCGGSFDRHLSSYNDNVIVFATLEQP